MRLARRDGKHDTRRRAASGPTGRGLPGGEMKPSKQRAWCLTMGGMQRMLDGGV